MEVLLLLRGMLCRMIELNLRILEMCILELTARMDLWVLNVANWCWIVKLVLIVNAVRIMWAIHVPMSII
jgi:hypothetical protein